MLNRSLDEITPEHFAQIVENGVEESRTIDFKKDYGEVDGRKRKLTGDMKRELLADVSAFANTDGGDLIIGVRESAGKAVEIVGLDLEDPDAELLTIQNIIRDLLEPRVTGIVTRAVPVDEGRVVLIIRTPRSWIAPHRVKPDNRFFARNSSGKYPMDVAELRQAFTLGEVISERIKRFRLDRLGTIERGEIPFPLVSGPLAAFHIVPLSAFTTPREIDFGPNDVGIMPPRFRGQSIHNRYCLEGKASSGGELANGGLHGGYGLLYRTGIIEAVLHIGDRLNQKDYVYASDIETVLVETMPNYFDRLKREGIDGPYYVFVTIIGVKGYKLHYGQAPGTSEIRNYATTTNIVLPEVVVAANYGVSEAKKTSDIIHNAFGLKASFNFVDPNGILKWRPR